MIESITIHNVATYESNPVKLNELKKFNYIFGSNGTGKTTISRVIAGASGHDHCNIYWQAGASLQSLVYNRDFVERNFNLSSTIQGVFTLGEDQVNAEKQIAIIKPTIDKLDSEIKRLKINLNGDNENSGKNSELTQLEDEFKVLCWNKKQKYDDQFQVAFSGVRNNAEKFKEKILSEHSSNTSEILAQVELEQRAITIFAQSPITYSIIPTFNADTLISYEDAPILSKRVLGKQDVDIAAMIKKLNNSDWVKQGRVYFEANDHFCPFCQQEIQKAFTQSLNDYFDDAFEHDTQSIQEIINGYNLASSTLVQQLDRIVELQPSLLDIEIFQKEKILLETKIAINKQKVELKKKEPSQIIELDSIRDPLLQLGQLIATANESISVHNQTVLNPSEKSTLTAQIWKFVLNELSAELINYHSKKKALDGAINGIKQSIGTKNQEKIEKETEVKELEKASTSIVPTKDAINSLLASFGFNAFQIDVVDTQGHYKIIRSNGDDASTTLSEGEKTFITFLYFYYLIKGSTTTSGISNNRIVVFDDPISSLDSDILYIVSSLIKGLFEEIRGGIGYIKQIFVLTHNVYFHKEITFNPKRTNDVAMNEETFWIVRKGHSGSNIENYTTNPIKSSYELLWAEVKAPIPSSLTLQNTLRRILENYFTMWGGIKKDEICAMFEGSDRLVCHSLFSWVNDGSHSIHDDLYISHGEQTNTNYLSVFKEIFNRSGHPSHYNMMMGIPTTQ